MITLLDTDYMDPNLLFAFRFLSGTELLPTVHTHNYYEYFFLLSGEVILLINGNRETLHAGDLVLIRPDDIHGYESSHNSGAEPCKLINISFAGFYFDAACEYLELNLKNHLLSPKSPPALSLPEQEWQHFLQKHEFFNFYTDTNTLKIKFRILLADILSVFYMNCISTGANTVKMQFIKLLEQMNTQENIEEGLDAMMRITGFSHGHLCRVMKEYLNTTPNQYLTELRMVYAANLLRNTDFDILTISIKVGFSSLSHFISLFKKRFGMQPSRYRKLNRT